MPRKSIVLVAGVAGYFGRRVAAGLTAQGEAHVIGLDVAAPAEPIHGLDFIQADLRNTLLPDLFRSEGIETLYHLAFFESSSPNEAVHGANVTGTTRVLTAAVEAGVRRIILRSSTMVYGSRPDNSAFLPEDSPLNGSRRSGTVRDLIEVESLCNDLQRQAPQTALTVLRFPSIVGPTIDSPMTRFLRGLWAPTLLGFDPMMQLIHEDDAVAALLHAGRGSLGGPCNVAAENALPLSQLMALAGKLPLPVFHPGIYWARDFLDGLGVSTGRCLPMDPDYLRYGWVADLARMHGEFGFAPRFTAVETLRQYAAGRQMATYLPDSDSLARDEERLWATMERRRRERAPAQRVPPRTRAAPSPEPPDAQATAGTAAPEGGDPANKPDVQRSNPDEVAAIGD